MILIVEDNIPNAELLKLYLERKGGFDARICTDGDEAVELCRSGEVRLVIMDIQLLNTALLGRPVSGVEICKFLKSHSDTQSIPVLLATAHAMKEEKDRFLKESCANAYLTKPFEDYGVLIKEIQNWL